MLLLFSVPFPLPVRGRPFFRFRPGNRRAGEFPGKTRAQALPDPERRDDYSIVRMSLKPVTSKISMMTSPTPVTFMVP